MRDSCKITTGGSKYGGMTLSELKRLKALEEENALKSRKNELK